LRKKWAPDEASKEGLLSERGKPDQFQVHMQRCARCERDVGPILLPIGEGNRILAQVSNGNIDELISRLQGRSREDEAGHQQCCHGAAGIEKRTVAPDRGFQWRRLSERGKHEQFSGAYAEIVRGVNAVLDAVITH